MGYNDVCMQNQVNFDGLDELVNFLDTEVSFEDIGLSLDRSYFYRLQARLSFTYKGRTYQIQLLGTNHTLNEDRSSISNSEKRSVDKFTSDVSKGDLILTEHGSGEKSRSNNFKDTLKSWLEENPELDGKIRRDHVFCQRGEIDYAADQAYERGAEIINMDMCSNPRAIGHIVERLGLKDTISEIKSGLKLYVPHEATLNRFVYHLLTKAGISVDYQEVEIQRCKEISERKLSDDEMRDDFMTQSVLEYLQSDRCTYVIAHTKHIKRILQRISKVGQIGSLSASLEYTPEKEYEIQAIRDARNEIFKKSPNPFLYISP
jgi:hypothetical protein